MTQLAGARTAILCVIGFFVGSSMAAPASARCYSRWYYPHPQSGCHVKRSEQARFIERKVNVAQSVSASRQHVSALPTEQTEKQPERLEIPIPDFNDIDWGKPGSDRLKGVAILRALADVQPR